MSIKRFINNNIDIIFFGVIIFVKLISLNFEMGTPGQSPAGLISGCLGSVFLLIALLNIFQNNRRIYLFIAFDISISFILITDIIYNRYFYDVTSIALIKQAGLTFKVKESIAALIHPMDFIYFADVLLIVPVIWLLKKRYKNIEKTSLLIKAFHSAILLFIGILLSLGSVKVLDKNQPGILRTLYDKKYIAANIGDLNFHFFDLCRFAGSNLTGRDNLSKADYNYVNSWFAKKRKEVKEKGRYFNSMSGKNLIIVQLESFQGFLLNRKIEGQAITPNLNKLAERSLVFRNCYSQTAGGGTSDAELLSNTSLFPAKDGAAYYLYSSNAYDSIARELNSKGYFTSVLHANRPGFWNRYAMYDSLGFDRFECDNKFVIDDVQGLGLGDKSFYKQSVKKMKEYPKPFYSFLISLSSHFPYKDSRNKINDILNVGSYEGNLIGDYLKSIKYSDEAIGMLIDDLKSAGLWENSVVVFYGDHYAIPYEKKEELARLIYKRNFLSAFEWFKEQKVVCMIHFPKEYIKGYKDIISGQVDLSPTLANLFGFNMTCVLGRDLINSKDGFFVNRNGVWADDKVVYLRNPDKIVDINSGKILSKEGHEGQFERAEGMLKISDLIMQNDLIKKLK